MAVTAQRRLLKEMRKIISHLATGHTTAAKGKSKMAKLMAAMERLPPIAFGAEGGQIAAQRMTQEQRTERARRAGKARQARARMGEK